MKAPMTSQSEVKPSRPAATEAEEGTERPSEHVTSTEVENDESAAPQTRTQREERIIRYATLARERFSSAATAIREAIRRKPKANTGTCPFDRLPQELRDQIWYLALSPKAHRREPIPAHFHVYRTAVFDACSYVEVLRRDPRPKLMQISLLLTCRAIYHEALRYLYEEQAFTLVLCAGLPRPRANLHKRKGLGKPEKCKAHFAKMRDVELVIQPGDRPDVARYAELVGSFLQAFDYGHHAKRIALHFNMGYSASSSCRKEIVDIFHRLADHYSANPIPNPPDFSIVTTTPDPQRNPPSAIARRLIEYDKSLASLAARLNPTPEQNITFSTLPRLTGSFTVDYGSTIQQTCITGDAGPICLRRGAWGNHMYHNHRYGQRPQPRPWTTRQKVSAAVGAPFVLAGMVAMAPVVAICWVADHLHGKTVKGQW